MMAVCAQVQSRPGSLILILGEGAEELAAELASEWGTNVTSVAARFSAAEGRDLPDPASLLADGRVFIDLDVFFWAPAFHLEVLALLRSFAKRQTAAFVWPGTIAEGVARYSDPGRPDSYEAKVGRALLVRSNLDALPGDAPFTTEWVGA